MEGVVFDIQRFALNDGPGIRTTVFLKGCPLRCAWCHNPESLAPNPQLSCDWKHCAHCGACLATCPEDAHGMQQGRHVIKYADCVACGHCVHSCPTGSLQIVGQRMDVHMVMKIILADRDYYGDTGGMTLSGGEPLSQPAYAVEIFGRSRAEGIHTCLDTSGFATSDALTMILPLTDLVLFDIKETDSVRHRDATGVALNPILKNLDAVNGAGIPLWLRCPIIPGWNDREDHFSSIASLSNKLNMVEYVDLLPYHTMGAQKKSRIGLSSMVTDAEPAPDDAMEVWREALHRHGCTCVRRG